MRRRLLAVALALAACGDNGGGALADGGLPPDAPGPACLGARVNGDVLDGAWDRRFTIAGMTPHDLIAPQVHDLAVDVDGSVLAAGRFQWLGGQRVPPLVRWRNGVWEPARERWELQPPPDGFDAVAVGPDGELALATAPLDGQLEIWLDDGSGLRVIGRPSGRARAMTWWNGQLWVAGNLFLSPGFNNLLAWDGNDWSEAPGGGPDGTVFALTAAGDELLVGGAFSSVGGIIALSAAGYRDGAWRPYDTIGFENILDLERIPTGAGEGELLAAGSLFDDQFISTGIMRWVDDHWEEFEGGVLRSFGVGSVVDIEPHDGGFDVIGCFVGAGPGGQVLARDVARWNGTAWEALDDDGSEARLTPWFTGGICGADFFGAIWDGNHQRALFDGERLWVGGAFSGAGGTLSPSLIAHDGDGWVAQGASGLGLGGSFNRVAANPERCEMYGLGTLSHAGGESLGRAPDDGLQVLRWNGERWEAIGEPLAPSTFCPGMGLSRTGVLALGCIEQDETGAQTNVVMRLEGDTLVRVPITLPGNLQALSWDRNGSLWLAGGSFVITSGTVAGFVARMDGDVVTVVEDEFDGSVTTIDARAAGDVMVGGAFDLVAGTFARHVARFDGRDWLALGGGVPATPLAIARDERGFYVSTVDEGFGKFLLGHYDGSQWRELASFASGLSASPFFDIRTIVPLDGGLLVGGTLSLNDGSGSNVAFYRQGQFRSVGGGVIGESILGDLGVSADSVWVGGGVSEVGPPGDRLPSVGVARWLRSAVLAR